MPVVRRLGVLRGRTRRRVVVPGGARSYLRGALRYDRAVLRTTAVRWGYDHAVLRTTGWDRVRPRTPRPRRGKPRTTPSPRHEEPVLSSCRNSCDTWGRAGRMVALRLPGWPRAPTRSGTRRSAFPESPPLDVGRPCRRAPRRRRARREEARWSRRVWSRTEVTLESYRERRVAASRLHQDDLSQTRERPESERGIDAQVRVPLQRG